MLRYKKDGTIDTKRDILVFKTELEYEDIFDLKEIYTRIHEWLEK